MKTESGNIKHESGNIKYDSVNKKNDKSNKLAESQCGKNEYRNMKKNTSNSKHESWHLYLILISRIRIHDNHTSQ